MNAFDVLRDSLYFFKRHLGSIVQLCLPLVIFEAFLQQVVDHASGPENISAISIVVGLLVYPLYTAALILFLDARSNGLQPRARDLLAAGLRLWPQFALLAAIMTLAILLGASLFVLPGIWLIVKLAFAEYLLVLRGLSPMKALHESFQLSSGYFWPMLGCILIVMLPLWLLDGWSHSNEVLADNALASLLLDCASRFLQLFSSVVLFRLFMLRSAQPEVE